MKSSSSCAGRPAFALSSTWHARSSLSLRYLPYVRRVMSARDYRQRKRTARGLVRFLCHYVRRQRVDFLRLEQLPPRRHGVLAVVHRIDEPSLLTGRKRAQVERRLGIEHARAVARRAILRVDLRALSDLGGRELLLRSRRRGAESERKRRERVSNDHQVRCPVIPASARRSRPNHRVGRPRAAAPSATRSLRRAPTGW